MKRYSSGLRSRRSAVCVGCTVLLLCIALLYSTAAAQVVRVGVYDNPPKVFFTQNGVPAGLYPDLLNSIAQDRGWEIRYVPGSWQTCLDRLASGEIDLLVDIAETQDRRHDFIFSKEPVLTNWGAVYTRKGQPASFFKDLENKSVALVKSCVHAEGHDGFRSLMRQYGFSFEPVEVDSYPEALMLLDSAQVDACVINRLYGALFAQNYEVNATPLVLNPKVLLFAGRKKDGSARQLLNQIDQSLKQLKANPDSIYHQAMGYYLGGGSGKWEEIQAGFIEGPKLSPEEQAWIRSHPVIKFSIDERFSPFEFLSQQGKFVGMAADYLSLISYKTGIAFQRVETGSWSQTLEAAKQKQIDLLPCLVDTDERRQFLSFTSPYIKFSRVIITAMDSSLGRQSGVSGLKGLKVGVQINSSHHDFMKKETGINPVLFNTFQDAVIALSKGKIDAVIGNLAVASHTIKKLSITNLKFSGYADPVPQKLCMGIRSDWPELTQILNRALASVTFREKSRILSEWFPLPTEAYNHIGLTRKQREWLLMHPRIKVAWDRHWAPIEFSDEKGRPKGISMEYLMTIEKILGVEFDMGHDLEWEQLESRVEKRQMDMFSCVAITPKRLSHLEFTDTYLSLPVVVFARQDMPYIRDMSELSDKPVAVVQGYAVEQWVSRDYPEFNLKKVATVEEGLSLLKKNQVDAFLSNVFSGNYYLSRIQGSTIKVAGETPYKLKLRMAVRKDWPELARILQKTLDALPEAEKTLFYRKWALVKYEKGLDYSLFKKIMAIVAVLVVAVVVWNRYMAAEIRRRKKVEACLAESEQKLRQKNSDLKDMESLKDNLAHMIVHDMRSPLTGIATGLSMLQKKLEELDLYPKFSRYLLISRNGVGTLNRMTQALLDIFKLESNDLPLAPEPLEVKSFANQVIEEMQRPAQMRNQRLSLSGEPCQAQFDPEIIRRVMTNLIENAFKASPEGACVDIRVAREDEHYVRVAIEDSGHGIPPEFQDKVFDKFSSLDSRKAGAVSSYGLGLTFCRLAVEAHGGRIQVSSREGEGSTFSFTLPVE